MESSSELLFDEFAVVGEASVVGVLSVLGRMVDPDVVDPDVVDALPVVAPPAGLADGGTGPMNTPSTPSFVAGGR